MKTLMVFALVFLLLYAPSVSTAQRTDLMQLESQFNTSPTPERVTALSKAYQEQALWFFKKPQFNNDSTLFYFDKAQALLENAQPVQNDLLAELYKNLSEYRFLRSESQLAAEMGAKALSCFEKTDKKRQNDMLHYDILRHYARAELRNDNRKQALDLFTKSLSLFQNEKNSGIMAMFWKDKGIFYTDFRNGVRAETQEALNDLLKSAEFYETSNKKNLLFLAEIYDALAWSYNVEETGTNKGIADSCDLYYSKLYALLPQLQNPIFEARYYSYWGNKLFRRGRSEESIKFTQQSQRIIDTFHLEYHRILSFNLNILGAIATEKKQWEQAEFYFTKARDIGLKQKNPKSEPTYLTHMVDIYQAKGDYKKAFIASNSFWAINAKSQEERSLKNLQESELQLNVLRQEKELNKKRIQQSIFIAALGIGALLLGFLYRNYRSKKRINLQLETLNKDLENKNKLLDKRNAENELLLKEIHHRVKNNLEVVSSLLALQSAQIDDPSVQDAMQSSQNRVQSMGILHQRLYQSEHLAFIEMKNYFINLSENILDSYNASERVKIDCTMKEIDLDVDTAVPIGLIVNELLTNSLKYAFTKGQMGTVKLSLVDLGQDILQLKIADNGIGKSLTDEPQGTGFGTQLVDLLTKQLDGTIHQEINNGTIISINFKRAKAA